MSDGIRLVGRRRRNGSGGGEVDFVVEAGSAAFRGHFPTGGVLPAIGHLFLVEAALRELVDPDAAVDTVERARFLAPVGPGDAVTVRLEAVAGKVRFEVLAGGGTASEGSLRTSAAATGEGAS